MRCSELALAVRHDDTGADQVVDPGRKRSAARLLDQHVLDGPGPRERVHHPNEIEVISRERRVRRGRCHLDAPGAPGHDRELGSDPAHRHVQESRVYRGRRAIRARSSADPKR